MNKKSAFFVWVPQVPQQQSQFVVFAGRTFSSCTEDFEWALGNTFMSSHAAKVLYLRDTGPHRKKRARTDRHVHLQEPAALSLLQSRHRSTSTNYLHSTLLS